MAARSRRFQLAVTAPMPVRHSSVGSSRAMTKRSKYVLSREELSLLKEILAIPTQSRKEGLLVSWIIRHAARKGWSWNVDASFNVYLAKGQPAPDGCYPCLCAHTDSVHEVETLTVVERGERLIALDQDGNQTGLGGDDKAGVYIALQLLDRLDVAKAAFFVSEEIGCVGSRASDAAFFEDVGYVIQWDSPCNDIVTYTCDGTQLFPDSGEFHDILMKALESHGATNFQHHPYTDVSILKRRLEVPCLNLPAGYFRMHSRAEYVHVPSVANSVALGMELLRALGCRRFEYRSTDEPGEPAHPVGFLQTHG